jgi:AcrR family transcriptional regulator
MGRPREFDEEEVLDRALRVFWERGFTGTSVADLVVATGVGRASLYGAFGDKDRLFQRVLDHYLKGAVALPDEPDPEVPIRDTVQALLRSWVRVTCTRSGPRGCFLLQSGTSAKAGSFARAALGEALKRLERQLVQLLAEGQRRGEISSQRSAVGLARLLVVAQQGIASAARAGWGSDRLDQAGDELFALVFRQSPL